MEGLEGLRVLELGEGVSAAYATKLMADLGADVIKVEELEGDRARRRGPFPGGADDPERSGIFLYLNTNKRGVALDLRRDRARLERLVASVDVLVHNFPPAAMAERGIGYEAFRRLNPRLVLCSITPFGLTGPYRDYAAEELTLAHGGGWANLSPGALERADGPPLKVFGHQCDFQAGVAAAAATLAACRGAQRSGRGEHIDFSTHSFVASFLEQALVHYSYAGRVATRFGQRLLYPWGIYACADGLIFLAIIEEDQWLRLVELMGRPEWAELEIFRNTVVRSENWDVLKLYLEEWTRRWKVEELYHQGQARRICFAPVFTLAEMSRQPHLAERRFFVDVEHPQAGRLTQPGAPYRLSRDWWRVRRPAPALGQHTSEVESEIAAGLPPAPAPVEPPRALPLQGVRVLDFTWVWAGPFCTLHLAHLGAEVIRVESSRRLDAGRRLPIFPSDMQGGPNRSGYYNQWNQGKKCVQINLHHPDGVALARDLAARSDVVVENFATGVMERLGLGYETLRSARPDLIMASISGYGQTGPQRAYMAYGPAIAPLTGLSSLTGYAGDVPREVGISYGDPNGGIHAAAAICAALLARERTGAGVHIDVSLWEAMAVLVAEGWMDHTMNGTQPPRMGNRDPRMAPHGCYRCAGEDAWVTIACPDDASWRVLCAALGQPYLAHDARFATVAARKRNEDALDATLSGWTATRDRWQVTRLLQAVAVPAFPSLSPKDLVLDPHLEARGFFARLPHPEVGVRAHAGIPWRLTHGPSVVRAPAPLLGQHTDEVLRELLGYSDAQIGRLHEASALV